MPTATLTRNADALHFSGTLDRASIAALWTQAQAQLAGITQLDLSAVDRIDSAGLALLAELAARGGKGSLTVVGSPAGLDELRAAYRLQDDLSFAA